MDQYKQISFFLFGELWRGEVKNIDKYEDMYKYAINLFKPFMNRDKFLKFYLFNEIDIQWFETLDDYLDDEFDLFMYEYSNYTNVVMNEWDKFDTNEKKINYLVNNNHILYKKLFDDTHMIHII